MKPHWQSIDAPSTARDPPQRLWSNPVKAGPKAQAGPRGKAGRTAEETEDCA